MNTRALPSALLIGGLTLVALTGCGFGGNPSALAADDQAVSGSAHSTDPGASTGPSTDPGATTGPSTDPGSATGPSTDPTADPAATIAPASTTTVAPTSSATPTTSTVNCYTPPTSIASASPTAIATAPTRPAYTKPPTPTSTPTPSATSAIPSASPSSTPSTAASSVAGLFSWFERPFAATALANQLLPADASYGSTGSAQAASVRTSAGTAVNSKSWGVTILLAKDSDPVVDVRSSENGSVLARIHMPSGTQAPGGSDKAVAVVAPDGYTAYEFYKLDSSGSGWVAKRLEVNDLRGTGADHGARASNTSLLWGIIRQADFREGVIAHTLAIGIPDSALKMGYVAPANAQDSNASSHYHGTVPMGTMFAIPKNADLSRLGLNKQGRMLATALQQYGAYVMRRSDSVALYAESSADDSDVSALRGEWAKLRPLLVTVQR